MSKEERDEFVELCEELDTTASREIRRFMKEFISQRAIEESLAESLAESIKNIETFKAIAS